MGVSALMSSIKYILLNQAERNILEAVKHPFIVDLLYAFQVILIDQVDLGDPDFPSDKGETVSDSGVPERGRTVHAPGEGGNIPGGHSLLLCC